MILFVDASAMVAILTNEADAFALEARFGEARERLSSSIALWETARAVARKRTIPLSLAYSEVTAFMAEFDVRLVPLGNQKPARRLWRMRAMARERPTPPSST